MKSFINDYHTPGQLLLTLLEDRGWNQQVLATVLGVDKSGITRLVSDQRTFDATIALALEGLFDVPAEQFLALQAKHDLSRARLAVTPDPGMLTRAKLFGELPIAEMIRRGWLDTSDAKDSRAVEQSLLKFFDVESADEITSLPHAAKKSNAEIPATPVQLAWLHRAREIASEMIVARYSQANGRKAVLKLKELLLAAEEARKVPRILAESGIRFVIVETLTSAKIDGACFWLNDTAPVIAMTMRFDRIDNFWFVLRHELEHVLQGHGKNGSPVIDYELEGERAGSGDNVSEEERIANDAASEFCVPQKLLDSFISRKAPFFAERDLIGFARTINVHPGLVAGQIQRKTARYDRFRNHLVKMRNIVAPSAIVDGWGDIAPVGL
ncbi:helix-turn-helix domain-containing protein [Oxalicibacterium faecigallinarum]|uniref:Transcriptional regulator n=1 Tax=Oxalicibacterium faecigallinarum TaxID=573741 RepID=A0A8J3ASS1_9BURK|nr:helix-turn-helix domain-containing protein [Oxalicibacterium faecigallinarum]GGI18174.1 transcriptional regulator [Oxalicibacterium faecigallinarum]